MSEPIAIRKVPRSGLISLKEVKGKWIAIYEINEQEILKKGKEL